MNHGRSYQEAVAQAKTNALYFQRSYFVFTDTSGNIQSEPVYPKVGAYTEVTRYGEVLKKGDGWNDAHGTGT